MKYLYYKAFPTLYTHPTFVDSYGRAARFLSQSFSSPESMLECMKRETGIALRECNWRIFGYKWGVIPIRITISDLIKAGLIKDFPMHDMPSTDPYYPYP